MALRLAITFILSYFVTAPVLGQTRQLTGIGMLSTEIASRITGAGDEFHVGDLIFVRVMCPPNAGKTSVSAHMQYKQRDGTWAPVPSADSAVGRAYTSPNLSGVRDFVDLRAVAQNTERQVSLFIPYDAAAIANGTYQRRYVITLWDEHNNDIVNTVLPGTPVRISNEGGKTTIKEVECSTCCKALATSPGRIEPKPESVSVGGTRFFDPATGKWLCPGALKEANK